MLKIRNPAGIAPPVSAYSHGVEVMTGYRWLHISGQVGLAPDGTLPADFESQARNVWRNLLAVLDAAHMDPVHLVRINAYLVEPAEVSAYRRVRDEMLGDNRPTSTLIYVPRLADPAWLVEIEGVAAMPA